ncbi:MAG: DUF4446 family protein [Candidatus Levybacteria bacterium]|nr:DUF4446 family protein [Candidatus Levybacteria bacterium]
MVFNLQILVFVIGFAWLIILTFFYLRLYSHYNNLTRGMSSKTLRSILEELLQEVKSAQKEITMLVLRCDKIEQQILLHIQKIGLLRFNPFKDTGGNQSFILTLLDANNTGVVISGLYSRLGTRWYAKEVIAGKGVDHELSEEEKRAIKEAKQSVKT